MRSRLREHVLNELDSAVHTGDYGLIYYKRRFWITVSMWCSTYGMAEMSNMTAVQGKESERGLV